MTFDDNDYERWKMWFGVRVSLDLAIERKTELGCERIGKWVCCKSYFGLACGLGDNRVYMPLYNKS